MAGSKTRFGFLGNGDEPPDSGEPGAARTIIGHDIHLPKLPSGFAQPGPLVSPTPIPPARIPYPPMPPAAVRAPMHEVITESIPVRRQYKPQKSRLARFLGRWTRSGHFQSGSRMGDSAILDDTSDRDLDVPRDTAGRNVLLVLAIAALTFLMTFAIVKMRQRHAMAPSVAGTQVAEKEVAPPLPPTQAPVVPALAKPVVPTPPERPLLLGSPVPSATVPSAGQPHVFPQAAPPSPAKPTTAPARTASPAPRTNPRPRKAGHTDSPSFDLPEHLKGELLPLGGQ
ncbi:MAG TPA: hypothetical protein VF524_13130 [Polyangia bacterium]